MSGLATILVAIVALHHLSFLVLEMFLWTRPAGRRAFRTTPEFARESAALAANQGLYNGFLAAGLLWGLMLGPGGLAVRIFFLLLPHRGWHVRRGDGDRKILIVQALPGALALAATPPGGP